MSEIDTKKGLLFTGVPLFLELVSNSRFDQIIIIPVFRLQIDPGVLETIQVFTVPTTKHSIQDNDRFCSYDIVIRTESAVLITNDPDSNL